MKTNTERLNIMAQQINEWAATNFPVHLPKMGVLEEVGELTHCFLKRFQKIRDMDKPQVFMTKVADALADATIYLLHDMSLGQTKFIDDPVETSCFKDADWDMDDPQDVEDCLAQIAEDAAWLLSGQEFSSNSMELHESIIAQLWWIAARLGLDFMDNLDATWRRVSKRDWVANPGNADKLAEMEEAQQFDPKSPGNEVAEPDIHK